MTQSATTPAYHWRFAIVLAISLWTFGPASLAADDGSSPAVERIDYALSFPAPHTHYVEVMAEYPTAGRAQIVVRLAVWTPGSYLVREYARHLEALDARTLSGEPLAIDKVAKNRWRLETRGEPRVRLNYRAYCHEMSVRTNWVEEEFALLNGAPTFLTLADANAMPHAVAIRPARGWASSWTGMPADPSGRTHEYVAPDYDTLVDSPILIGNPAVHRFEVDGKAHYLVNQGEDAYWDGERSVADVRKIVLANRSLWGSLPYDKYVFLNLITESGGGLEHKNSTVMMTSRWRSRIPKSYRGWLGLVSHEYFHAWNVKRLRPIELGPFDYEHEAFTKSLWIAEGITSYYGSLNLCRCGLMTPKQYLRALSKGIENLQRTPGRKVRPLALSSYDAWIKQYRPDENSRNTQISYYTKGEVVGFLLDMEIRRRTGGQRSLDDLMRLAYSRYSGKHGYRHEQFLDCASEVAGEDLGPWFDLTVNSTAELGYQAALDWLGLEFKKSKPRDHASGASDRAKEGDDRDDKDASDKIIPGWLGLSTKVDDGRLLVSGLRRGTPAYDQGFNVDDEIVAIDDYRVEAKNWSKRLEQYRPGDAARVLIARRQKLLVIDVTFAKKPEPRWRLSPKKDANEAQVAACQAWLGTAAAEAKSQRHSDPARKTD